MIFNSSNNDKLEEDSSSYSNTKDNSLVLSLLTNLLPSLDHSCARTSSSFRPPLSFEDPFDDPDMEPLPLKSQGLSTHTTPYFDLRSEPNETNPRQEGKRTCEKDFFAHNGDIGFLQVKRQRTSQLPTILDEESAARFRPYQEKQWRDQFQKLIQYKLKNGHCCVPHSYSKDPILARWVKRQRYQYKKFSDNNPTSTMTTRRIQELESIGFIWQSHASAWLEKLNDLKVFKQRMGHCNVPSHYPENASLSTWVKCQRRQYKLNTSGASSSMTLERCRVLQSLSFVFEPQLSK
ncbi:unnamed protein product [Cylindrotheca closterium]|uniref:Helicase-associated domain-containing protein n=2 Tax=Cylindrotheca closterium TaxID=2856 RepID=A0AAD2GD41_9STRA|nr:unnamed protein product [Cylindrotheca closterium]